MRRAALLLIPLVIAAAGCATVAQPPTGITLLRHKPPEQGGPRVFPQAGPSGVLDLSGPCVGVEVRPGETQILISSSKARVGRDGRGYYLQYDGARFRHGQSIKGGGGYFDELPAAPLDGPVPEACRKGPFLILVDIKPFDRSKLPPPTSPPPPPVR